MSFKMKYGYLFSGLVAFSALGSAAIVQQPETALPPDNEVLGGHFGLVNIFNVVSGIIGGFKRPAGDDQAFMRDLETIFPKLKESSFRPMLQMFLGSHNISSRFPKSNNADTLSASAPIAENFVKNMLSKVTDPNRIANLTAVCDFIGQGTLGQIVDTFMGLPKDCANDFSGGTGPYKANWTTDGTLPYHTIYVPNNPPANEKLPVVVFGNGLCIGWGTMYSVFLTELASHGFMVIATGGPSPTLEAPFGKVSDLKTAIDWLEGPNAKKYNVDLSTLAASGQSCGGLEAYSVSWKDPRVKHTILLNSAAFEERASAFVGELTSPVAYFVGGPKDIGYNLVSVLGSVSLWVC